jgi:hypothetical protein
MPSLVVLTRSLRQSGGASELGPEQRSSVHLPRAGDAVAALLGGLGAAKHSLVEFSVPESRLLDAHRPLRDVADDETFCRMVDVAPPPARAEKVPRVDVVEQEPVLRLVAVPRGER